MSTRATIVYLPDHHLHLYEEVFDDSGGVYLEYQAHEVEMGSASFESPPDGPTMEVIVRLDTADFDALVDAYIAARTVRQQASP